MYEKLSQFGLGSFRLGQKEIINSVLAERDALALLPTGGGKSLCYQLPAMVRTGVTIVISPLIALMNDQVRSLRALGGDRDGIDIRGNGGISIADVNGVGLATATKHRVQIFFIGIGDDADMNVGRILAEASGAEFQGVADQDLAELLEEFSSFF